MSNEDYPIVAVSRCFDCGELSAEYAIEEPNQKPAENPLTCTNCTDTEPKRESDEYRTVYV